MNNLEKQNIKRAINHCIKYNDLYKLEKILTKKDFDINDLDYDSNTILPLSYAAIFKSLDAMKLLISHGADIDEVSLKGGETALITSSRLGYVEEARFLISKNADINKTNANSTSALMEAAYANKFEVVELLLDNGADIMNKNKFGFTLIEILDKNENRIEMVNYLKSRIEIAERKAERKLEIQSETRADSLKKEAIKAKKINRISGFKI